ncbi:TonB-dependent receptor [Flavobacterium magnum]|uniref:TonB-dependent receptor n=1 Tax=Flavobacterium magnum TaxID=2162713 RepID=A0A2S0RGL3_9FLAO|nr:TonB-dependent receptor plug domain-containing protein [Flavobacterium magnum]AWA29852.1 TonB-dependent receptor [Flavobacterium magnum]
MICWISVFSQQRQPLKNIIRDIEREHSVHFNFIDEQIGNIDIDPPESSLSLAKKIFYLENHTPLHFDVIGGTYISVSLKKNNDAPPESEMKVSLEEVAVDKYLTTGISKKSDGVYQIKPKKLGILPGLTDPDVLQTMQQIPGIYSADETVSNINIRGGTHDETLFLWNGLRMFQTGHFFGLISAFNPYLNDKIEIYKNGTSAFYGESVSGVVAISSGLAETDSTACISANMIWAGFNMKIRTSEKAVLTLSARRSMTDFFSSPAYKKYYNRIFQNTIVTDLNDNQAVNFQSDEYFYFYDTTVQYQQNIEDRHTLTFSAIAIKNSLDLYESTLNGSTSISKNSTLGQQNFGAIISWKTNWNMKNTSEMSVYSSNYNLDSRYENISNNQIQKQKNSITDSGLRLAHHYMLTDLWTLSGGYQYIETGVRNDEEVNNPAFLKLSKKVLRTHVGIAETDWKAPNRQTTFRLGLRTNYIKEFGKFLFEPRMQVSHAFNGKFRATVSAEQKSQSTSQVVDLQQDFLGVEKRRWVIADNALIPVRRSRQIEIGLAYKDKKWLVTFDNYLKKVQGISTSGQSFQNQLEFVKLNGSYLNYGSELLVQRNLGRFYAWLSYAYNNNKYNFPDYIPPKFANNYEISHMVSGALIYDWKKLKTALGAKWYSGRAETTPISTILTPNQPGIIYNNPNNDRLADFFQMNFSVSYSWKVSKKNLFEASFSLLNLLNKRNTINRYYRVNTATNSAESVNTYALERTPNLSLKMQF